jgi:hypothetical protein
MDEAMNPLTMVVTGRYGELLPKQNGDPFRVIVQWNKLIAKYRATWAEHAVRDFRNPAVFGSVQMPPNHADERAVVRNRATVALSFTAS